MPQSAPWGPEFATAAKESMAVHGAPALVAAFSRDGKLVHSQAFGLADRENSRPVTPETVFGVASVTKSFTALAIMQLVDAGKLKVSDPIVMHLPEFRLPDAGATQAATIEHLLTHTASLPPLPTLGWAIEPSR